MYLLVNLMVLSLFPNCAHIQQKCGSNSILNVYDDDKLKKNDYTVRRVSLSLRPFVPVELAPKQRERHYFG